MIQDFEKCADALHRHRRAQQRAVRPARCATPPTCATPNMEFAREKHIQYFLYHLRSLPAPYGSLDSSRMTVLYFVCSGLDVLDALDRITPAKRSAIVEWVYAQQVLRSTDAATGAIDYSRCGFRGSPYIGCAHCEGGSAPIHAADDAHITMTYTALCVLRILGDSLERFRRADNVAALRGLQESDGSFRSVLGGSEKDMRFIFCAFAISSMLNDWSGFDVDRSISYIVQSQAYDGAFGLAPHTEGHGGSTYCAVASLALAQRLDALVPSSRDALLRWCIGRACNGFSGRPNKPADSCYSFWIGATLRMLGAYEWTADGCAANRAFNLGCQGKVGGFGKQHGSQADILHSYMGLSGLSLMGADELRPLRVEFGLTARAAASIDDEKRAATPAAQ